MTTAELKISLINQIIQSDDEQVIKAIQLLLDFEKDSLLYPLSSDQIARLEEAEAEYKRGKVLTSEEADAEVDRWLNEE